MIEKTLRVITDKDIGLAPKTGVKYKIRKAARAVVFNKDEKIAILFASKYKYYKLPGGGVKPGENLHSALHREVKEETGCTINIKKEVGTIVEYRDRFELKQFSYCFVAEVKEDLRKILFTDKELSEGFELKWVSLNEAIKILQSDKPSNYEGKFVIMRDLIFLKKVKKILE